MDERQEQQIEITFRLSAGLLGQLARLVAAVSGGETGERRETAAPSPETAAGTSEEEISSGNFDFERFRELSAQGTEPELPEQRSVPPQAADLPNRAAEQAAPALENRTLPTPDPETVPPRRQVPMVEELPTREPAPAEVTELPDVQRMEYAAAAEEPGTAAPAPQPGAPGAAVVEHAREDAEALSRRFERDGRRYDSGFSPY